MDRVLLTGTNSYIGTNYRKFSQQKDIEEVSLIENDPEEIDFSNYDVILHLAAIVHQSKKIPESEYFKINRDLCLKTAIKARNDGVRQFIFLSTLKVYGGFNNDNSVRNEDSPCFPDDNYGKSKYEAELELRKLENKKFKVSVIRTPLVYGEGVRANMLRLIKLVDRLRFLPFGCIDNRRNLTYIENLTGFIDRVIETGKSGVFVVMDEGAISTTKLVRLLARDLNRNICLFKLPEFIVRIGYLLKPDTFKSLFGSLEVNNDKTKVILNYKPPLTTEEGLRRTVSAYQDIKNKGCE